MKHVPLLTLFEKEGFSILVVKLSESDRKPIVKGFV